MSEKAKLPVQNGISFEADFEEQTWTFSMEKGFSVRAGAFSIMGADEYEQMFNFIDKVSKLHPDGNPLDIIKEARELIQQIS